MELHISTRQKLTPDPDYDSVMAIFFVVWNDTPEGSTRPREYEGIFVFDPSFDPQSPKDFLVSSGVKRENVTYFSSEVDMINAFVQEVQVRSWLSIRAFKSLLYLRFSRHMIRISCSGTKCSSYLGVI